MKTYMFHTYAHFNMVGLRADLHCFSIAFCYSGRPFGWHTLLAPFLYKISTIFGGFGGNFRGPAASWSQRRRYMHFLLQFWLLLSDLGAYLVDLGVAGGPQEGSKIPPKIDIFAYPGPPKPFLQISEVPGHSEHQFFKKFCSKNTLFPHLVPRMRRPSLARGGMCAALGPLQT